MRRMTGGLAAAPLLCQSGPGEDRMNRVDRIASGQAGAEAPTTCLNCAAPLAGPFCAQCGQKAQVHRSLRAFLADFVAGMLNFEGRLWHTLPLLAWKPGELTRRYVDGQRARFVSPIGLYLFTVFLMFATLGFTGSLDHLTIGEGMSKAAANQQHELDQLGQQRAAAVAQGKDPAALDRKIRDTQANLAHIKNPGEAIQEDLSKDADNPAWLRDTVRRVAADPRGTATRVQDAASKYSWLLIPLSVPVLWLLFPLRRSHLYDHTVFVTYSLSFMMFLVIVGGLLVLAGVSRWLPGLALIPPVHMYRQLKGAYRLRWWSAAIRTFLLLNAALLVLVMWFLTIAALGIME